MHKARQLKKYVASILVLVLLLSSLMPAFANANTSNSGNESNQLNNELLQFLTDEYGEEQAAPLLKTIQDLGLVDENNNFLKHPISFNGKDYTLEEMKKVLSDKSTDLTQQVQVDGVSISLEVLQKIIAIEEYIELIRQTISGDETTITPEHLESLKSMISQVNNEGLTLSDEDDNAIGIDNASGNLFKAANTTTSSVTEDYEDETYVTVTKYETYLINNRLDLTLVLNEVQNEEVSFSYELIEGSLGGLTERYPTSGEVIFQPGETKKTLSINTSDLTLQQMNVMFEYGPESKSIEEFRNDMFLGFSRANYIHFKNYKNLDSIKFNFNYSFDTVDRDRVDVEFFSHMYNGGAYLAYSHNYSPYYHGSKELFKLALAYGIEHDPQFDNDPFKILSIKTRSGHYTTGQMIPYVVEFNKFTLHKLPVDVAENDPRLELMNGQIAQPAIITPSADYWITDIYGNRIAHNGAYSFSFIGSYQTIINKDMKRDIDGLKVKKSAGEGNPSYYQHVYDENSQRSPDEVFPDAYWEKDFSEPANITISYAKSDAFDSITLDKSTYKVGDTATVKVPLINADGEASWIIDGATTPEEINKRLVVSIGNKEEGIIPIDWKKGEDGLPVSPAVLEGTFKITEDLFDLMTDSNRAEGKLRAKIYYNRDENNAEGMENFGLLADNFANFTISPAKYIYPEDLEITYPTTWPSGVINQVFVTNKVETKLGYNFPSDATFNTPDQFEWRSNDETIATITKDGIIVPKKEGTVTFTLTAKNNGLLTTPTEITSVPIEIKAGGPPSIVVPDFANKVSTQKNKDATILWLTNVMTKYKEMAGANGQPEDAHFKVELYEGNWDETQIVSQNPIQSWSASTTEALINTTSFTIPGEYLQKISAQQMPSYTVRISTKNPSSPGDTLTALSYIVVKSAEAVITLDKSMGQFITDDIGTVNLKWNLANFDSLNKGDFEFKVTKNGVLVPGSLITFNRATNQFSSSDATETGGTYTLKIDPVSKVNKKSKDVYAITLAAKNSLDATWSYDSLYLQVYKHDAFQIQIDGVSKSAHQMSNEESIKNMTNDERLALKRNINLVNEMSINYKDFTDLGEITDQFQWQSSNNEIGLINFRNLGKLTDITKLNYATYQPKQGFSLTGTENGETTITATHAKTGIRTEVDVTVNTLRDKLYLFQFYPKTATTITYTNGKGEEKSFTSNKTGELALYDEYGVDSDVYVTSKVNDTTYTGVISHETLLSKEQDPALIELYPINILQLRELSKVEVFFKTPDGKPYTGKVTYRGGVYKNGNYCEPSEISGDGVITQLGPDGKLDVMLDTTDFYSRAAGEKNAATLSAKDKIELVFEFTFDGDRYFPQFMSFDGNTSPVDMVVFGEKISRLVENTTAKQTPFIANQYVTDDKNNNKTSIFNYKGKFGPNNQFPNITLTTEIMWWNEQVDEAAYVELYNEVGLKPQGQSYQTIKYPFTNTVFTRHSQVLNKDTIWLEKAESSSIQFKLYDGNREFRKSLLPTASITNMIGVEEIDANELNNMLDDIESDMEETTADVKNPSGNDKMIKLAMDMLGKLSFDMGSLKMKIMPTEDPLVYKTVIATSFGNLPSTEAGNKGGSSSSVEFMQDGETSLVPGLMDLYRMNNGTYNEFNDKKIENVQQGKANGKGLFSIGGYYLGEVKYNKKVGKWEHLVLGGGFNAGGGYELTRTVNQSVGPIPVTFSLTVGGGLEVDFKASVLFDQIPELDWSNPSRDSVNDYLTSLRMIAYVEVFGGIGFDYSVIAAKIGMFGRVTMENTSSWLNRDYLANASDRVQFGNKLTFEGIVGIKATIKFLFFSKSWTFASLRYSHSWVFDHWNDIQAYWEKYAASPLTAENMNIAIAAYIDYKGIEDEHVFESNTLEDRSYLSYGERSWNVANRSRFKIASLDPVNAAPSALQTNAYPYANPEVANDGSLFVYLSDGNSTAIEDTVASWAKKVGDSYVDQGPIADDAMQAFGDSNLQIAGEGDNIAAVWVTQKDKIEKEAGEEVSDEDIVLMNNSAEIMVSIYDGSKWTTQRLTENANPDLAPVVSINNGKVFVAYRSVYASNPDNPLDFSESDSILYTVYDLATNQWSDVETLYNGTNGTVMGLSAHMLSDGTAGVVYSVNNSSSNQTITEEKIAGSDNEIIYVVIDTEIDANAQTISWKTKGVKKNLQVTNDDIANENPQITSATFGDNEERFIIAWHTTSDEVGFVEHDIKLLAVNKDGETHTGFVDSMNALQSSNDIKIHPNFTFVKMTNSNNRIENLSILWKEAETEFLPTETLTRDVIKAVKFGLDGEEVFLSGAIDVATMADFTEVDHLSAYVSNATNNQIKALILGTTYTTDANVVGTIKNGGEGDDIPVSVSKSISAMYTATEKYSNKFTADEIQFSPTEIIVGYDLPIQFSVVNQGMNKIKSVRIEVDGQKTDFTNVSIAPNNSQAFIAPYTVPSQINDIPYSVEVEFSDGEVLSTKGTVNLDIPDVGISNVQIVEEEGGQRILSVPIYNKNDTHIGNNDRIVKFGLYRDTVYTDENLIGKVMEINNPDDLNLINQGGYSVDVEFDLQDYLTSLHLSEIPEDGITIFLHSWVEDKDGNVVVEFDESNNDTKVSFENLAQKYNKSDVLLLLEQTNGETNTSVNLSMQNMRMASVSSGNVLLNLLDENGDIIESEYLVDDASNLLNFGAEEKKSQNVQFDKKGDAVQAMFFYENADKLDSTLSALTLSGAAVNFDANKTDYKLQTKDLKKTNLYAVASNSESIITLLDGAGNEITSNKGFLSIEQSLKASVDGELNEFVLSVSPESSSGKPTNYRFGVANTNSSQQNLELLVKGSQDKVGKYLNQATVSLSPYNLDGFAISKASYTINDGKSIEIAYDGKTEKLLTTIKKAGVYTIAAKIELASGLEYDLDPVTFEVVVKEGPGGGTNGGQNGGQNGEPSEEQNPVPNSKTYQPYIKGDGKQFRPNEPVSRGQMAAMLARNLQATPSTKAYTDVPTTNWAYEYIMEIKGAGIMTGRNEKTFDSNGTVTRAQMASIAYRWIQKQCQDNATSDERCLILNNIPAANFKDVPKKHWALESINLTKALGIMVGDAKNQFRPEEKLTRAQAVKVLNQLFQRGTLTNITTPTFKDVPTSHWAFKEVEEAVREHD